MKFFKWEKLKKQKRMVEIENIEKDIDSLFKKRVCGMLSNEYLSLLVDLEERKKSYLRREEGFGC